MFGSGRGGRCWGRVGDRIGFGLYQFWRNLGKVGHVSCVLVTMAWVVFIPVASYRYLLPNLYLSVADIANPDLFSCGSRTWISLDIRHRPLL